MKYLNILAAFILISTGFAQNKLYISSETEVSTFSGYLHLVDTDLENNGHLIIDDHLQFLGTDQIMSVVNNGIIDASSIGFSGESDYQSQGIFENISLYLEDNATLHLISGGFQNLSSINGETNDRTITGEPNTYLHTQRNVGTASTFGNIGFELLSADITLGLTDAYRRYGTFTIDANESIDRYYEIIPETNDNLNASGRFYFYDVDVDIQDINELSLYQSDDNGNNWMEKGGILNDGTDNNYLELNEINSLTIWAMAESSTLSDPENSINNIAIYPNPANEVVYLAIPQSITVNSMTIIDISGSNIPIFKVNGTNNIRVNHLSEGLYFLTIESDQGQLVKKIMVTH